MEEFVSDALLNEEVEVVIDMSSLKTYRDCRGYLYCHSALCVTPAVLLPVSTRCLRQRTDDFYNRRGFDGCSVWMFHL